MSKQKITLGAEIKEKDGHKNLVFNSRDYYLTRLSKFPLGKVTVTIDNNKPVRSTAQNNFLWLYYTLIEEETGNDRNDLHEYFKRKHLPPKMIKVMGKEIKIPASTTKLSKYDFGEYIRKIEVETNILAPNPEDAGYYSEKHQIQKPADIPYPEEEAKADKF